jgi:Fe-S-cluster containining protein
MIEVKLEEVLLTHALARILDEEREALGDEGIRKAVSHVKKYAEETLNADDKRQALLDAFTIIDEFQDEIEEDQKRKISCRKGCAFCCHLEVQVTDLEKDLIMDYAKEHGIKYNEKKLEEQLQYNEQTLPLSDVSRCVFLSNQNTCNIYEVRPLHCRKYLVLNDPKFCNAKKYPSHSTKVHFHSNTEILASAILTAARKMGSMAEIMLDKRMINGTVRSLPEK